MSETVRNVYPITTLEDVWALQDETKIRRCCEEIADAMVSLLETTKQIAGPAEYLLKLPFLWIDDGRRDQRIEITFFNVGGKRQ